MDFILLVIAGGSMDTPQGVEGDGAVCKVKLSRQRNRRNEAGDQFFL
jgi:hypothetical protein